MITKKDKNDELALTLIPNKSSSINENFIFFGFLSILCLTFGVGFFVLGATMILPFAGLEIIILILVLRANGYFSITIDPFIQSYKAYASKHFNRETNLSLT